MADEQNRTSESDRNLLSHLVQRYLAEQITESESERLYDLIESSPENQAYFREQLDTHFLLQKLLPDVSGEGTVAGILELCALRASSARQNLREATVSTRPKNVERPTFLFKWVAVPLLLCAMIVGIYSEFFRGHGSMAGYESYAQITETMDVRWGDGNTVFKSGAQIGNEFIRFEEGIVKVQFHNGVELILEGPTEFIVSGKLRTFCQKGKVNVHVPKTARGFELTTPFSRIVDLGTEFSVVSDDEATEIHMLQGKAEISRDKNARVHLSQGKAIRAPKIGEMIDVKLNPGICLRNERFEKLLTSFFLERAEMRQSRTTYMIDDPDLLCRFDGAKFYGIGRTDLKGGRQHLAQRGREVTRLRNMHEGIDLNISGEYKALTLLMMVRVHSLPHVSRLCISGDYYQKPGTLLWQLDQTGLIQFHIHSSGQKNFLAFDVPNGFQHKDYGTWTLFAVTLDPQSRMVRHYKDDALLAEFPWSNPESLRLENISVGNDSRQNSKRIRRFLNADIAELQIYRRALSAEEIKEIYDVVF